GTATAPGALRRGRTPGLATANRLPSAPQTRTRFLSCILLSRKTSFSHSPSCFWSRRSSSRACGADGGSAAGGIVPADAVRPRAELTEDTLFRCLHAAEIYHQGKPCPVIVTGGTLDPGSPIPPVAPFMRDLLVHLGVSAADVVIEDRSRTTYESAVETRRIL